VLTWIVKCVIAAPLVESLPDAGPFHLRDYGRLDAWQSPMNGVGWFILIGSAAVGAVSHILIDSFTHGFGWVVQNVGALQAEAFVLPDSFTGRPVYVHDLLQLGGTVIGAAITLWCLRSIGEPSPDHRVVSERAGPSAE